MASVTVPLPVSLAPFVTVIQLTLLVAVHGQLPGADTFTVLVAPSAGTLLIVVGVSW